MRMLDNHDAADTASSQPRGGWLDVNVPCRDSDPRLWFSETVDSVARAKRLCHDCPLRLECLAGAVRRQEPWGVWGGELFDRGVPVATKRRAGRPRKNDGATTGTAA